MSYSNPAVNWIALGSSTQFTPQELAIGPDGTLYALWNKGRKVGIEKLEEQGNRWTNIGKWDDHRANPNRRALYVDKQKNIYVLLEETQGMVLHKSESNGTWSTVNIVAPVIMAVDGQGSIYGYLPLNDQSGYYAIYKYYTSWEIVSGFDYNKYYLKDMRIDSDNNIFALFQSTTPNPSVPSVYIYKYDATSSAWTCLGRIDNVAVDNTSGIRLAIDKEETTLYVAGDFTGITSETGTLVQANHIAKWDGTTWSPLGGGSGLKYFQTMDCGANGTVYVGGGDGTAKWDGNKWTPVGGINGSVFSIVVDDEGNVYAGGDFYINDNSNTLLGRNVAYIPAGVHDASSLTQTAKLPDNEIAPDFELGYAVSISKDKRTIAALARNLGSTGNQAQSSLYIFSRSSRYKNWTQKTKTSVGVTANFCSLVKIGEVDNTVFVFVSASNFSSGGLDPSGAVIIYSLGIDQSLTTSTQTLENPETVNDVRRKSLFGESLAIGKNTLVVGAPNYYMGAGNKTGHSGYAYVFTYDSGSKIWGAHVPLISPDAAANDKFGHSVAISGDGNTIVIGAPGKNQAYLFTRPTATGNWSPGTPLGGPKETDGFGDMVAISADGTRITISARTKDQTFVFSQNNSHWEGVELPAGKTIRGEHIGHAVAISRDGKRVILGDPYDPMHPDRNSDAAYIIEFNGETQIWEQVRILIGIDTVPKDMFGM
jgi:hypothetical protein